jgi:hypothetical protein
VRGARVLDRVVQYGANVRRIGHERLVLEELEELERDRL